MVEAVELAIGEGPVDEQGAIAAAAGLQHVRFPLDREKGLLLASEAGVGQILGGGAGANGNSGSPWGAVSDADFLLEPRAAGRGAASSRARAAWPAV